MNQLLEELWNEIVGRMSAEDRYQAKKFRFALERIGGAEPFDANEYKVALGLAFYLSTVSDPSGSTKARLSGVNGKGSVWETVEDRHLYSATADYLNQYFPIGDVFGLVPQYFFAEKVGVVPAKGRYWLKYPSVTVLRKLGENRFAKPIVLAWLTASIGFGQLPAEFDLARFFDKAGPMTELLSALRVTPRERFVVTALTTHRYRHTSEDFDVYFMCQSRTCKASKTGMHLAEWIVYCSDCWGAEICCQEQIESMHWNSLAPSISFTNTCRHIVFDYRSCFIERIELVFGLPPGS